MKHPLTNLFLANRISIDRFWPISIGYDGMMDSYQ